MSKRFIKLFGSALVIALIFFLIGNNIARNAEQVKPYIKNFNPYLIIISFILLFPPMIIQTYLWKSILNAMNVELSFRETFSIYYIGNLGKYIPGKIWQFFMMAYIAKEKGLSATRAFSASFVGQMLSVAAGMLMAFITLGASLTKYLTNPLFFVFILLFLSFIFLLFFKPRIIEFIGFFFAAILGRSQSLRIEFSPGKLLKFTLIYFIIWILVGLSFYLICLSFFYVNIKKLPFLVGSFSLSVVIGFLSVFAPGGIGVREGLITVILPAGNITNSSLAGIIAIVARIIFTCNEIALFILAWAFRLKGVKDVKKEIER